VTPTPGSWPGNTRIGQPYALLALLQVHWFVRLRWVFAGVTLGALATERFVQPAISRPWPVLAAVLGGAGGPPPPPAGVGEPQRADDANV